MTTSMTDSPLAALGYLVGRWAGEGAGPTFRYREEVVVAWTANERWLRYQGAAYDQDDGHLMHAEEGYLGWDAATGAPYAVLVYPNGIVEQARGTLTGAVLDLETSDFAVRPPGHGLRWLRRRIEPSADGWRYTVWLRMEGKETEEHAISVLELRPAPAPSPNLLIGELAALPDRLAALLADRTDDALRRRPPTGGWSAQEIACHLRDVARVSHERLFLLATHEQPFLPAFDEDALARENGYQQQPTAGIVPEVRSWREETTYLLEGLEPAAWQNAGVHEEAGAITLLEWAIHMADHDALHLRDLRRLLDGD